MQTNPCNDPFPNDPFNALLKEREVLECEKVCGHFGLQTAGGHPKSSPRPRQPLFAVPELGELEVLAGYYRAQNDYTHTFLLFGN